MVKLRINIITLLLVISLIPFLSISGIRLSMDTLFYQIWQIASAVFLFYLVCKAASEIKLNWAVVLFSSYQAIILLSSLLNNSLSAGILTITVAALLLFMLLQSRFYHEILQAMCIIVTVSLLINFPLMLQYTEDENVLFFIGGKNALSMFLIPGTFLLLIRGLSKFPVHQKRYFFLICLCIASVFIGSSATGIVVAAITVCLIALLVKYPPKKWVYISVILGVYALFLIFTDDFFVTQHWLLFTKLLGKDSTLTSRTAIWNAAKELISSRWLFGWGRGVSIFYVNSSGIIRPISEAHNFILEILVEGGFAALSIYSLLVYKAISYLNMNIKKNQIVFVALCIILINGLTESTLNNFFVTIILGVVCRYADENRGKCIRNGQTIQKPEI